MKKKTLIVMFAVLLTLVLAACGGAAAPADVQDLPANVSVKITHDVMNDPNVVLLDVREVWEYNEGHIPGITLLPMGEITSRLSEIPTDKEVIVTCRSGNRSQQVVNFLVQQGFDNVHNMDGGILAWQAAGFEVER